MKTGPVIHGVKETGRLIFKEITGEYEY